MQVLHTEYQTDYDSGYNSTMSTIKKFGFEFAHKQFLTHYPPLHKMKDMADFYYGTGAIDALVKMKS